MKLKYILFFLLFILVGCTIPTNFYIQNLTNRSISLKVTFQKPYKEFTPEKGINFYSVDGLKISKNLSKHKKVTKLDFEKIDDKTFVINLPPLSTTQIESTRNFNYNIDKIEFENKKRDLGDLTVNSTRKKGNYIYQIKY